MASLWMVMLGGRHAAANIEVHDVVFAVGETLESLYPQLKQKWFGIEKGLHIDAWMKIETVESAGVHYQVVLKPTPSEAVDKLYMLNLGGYDAADFGELHRYLLVIAANQSSAKQYGKTQYAKQWQKPHTDHIIDVDDCIRLEHIDGQYVHLLPADAAQNTWKNTYITL